MPQNVEQEDKEIEKMRKLIEDKSRCSNPKNERIEGREKTWWRRNGNKSWTEENSSELKKQILVKIIEKNLYIHLVSL